jgi:iduronate 2-sulfatase
LTQVCGVRVPSGLDGQSLRPLLQNPETPWNRPAYTVVTRGERMGRSIATERFRYTEWDDGRAGLELYDHNSDPHEYRNLANDPVYSETLDSMKLMIQKVHAASQP